MTRTQLVMANWKQQGSETALTNWLNQVNVPDLAERCPVLAGAQLVSAWTGGAYTGEVSAAMLREFGVAYTLVGHSERRQWLLETADSRRAQLAALWQQGITPVLCVGETATQHQQGQTFDVLWQQLAEVLGPQPAPGPLVLAYEPVFAIGSGQPLSAPDAQQVHQQLRQLLQHWYSAADCQQIRILYGGSVNSNNAAEYLRYPDIDGVLVGGGSLKANSFNTLCRAIAGMNMEKTATPA